MLSLGSCASNKRPQRPDSQAFVVEGPRVPLVDIARGVEVFSRAGNIRVRSSSDAWVEPTYSVCADSQEAAVAIAATATIGTARRDDGVTHIEMIRPTACPLEKLAADSMLALPVGIDVDLRTVNGVIDTSSHAPNNAKLHTTDGNLIVGPVQNDLQFETQSGRVELLGKARVATGSTDNGDILVNTIAPGARYELTTKSGSCRLHIDPVLSAQVIYRTKRGSLRVEIEDTQLERRAVPRFDDWVERRIMIHGAAPVAKASLIIVESTSGDLILARPASPRPSTARPAAAIPRSESGLGAPDLREESKRSAERGGLATPPRVRS